MSTASSAQRLTTTDALSYLKIVKEMFQDKRDKYSEFLDIMKDFKAQRVDTSGVILRVKELFKGYRDLILGFNTFLPKGYEITLPPEDEPFLRKKPVEFDEAISFVNKIKTRFQGDDHVYKAFLDVLNMYRKDNKSITEVYQEVSVLFQGHADLLVEFTHFLPDTSCAATVQYGQPGRTHTLHGDDRPNDVEKKIDVSYVHTNHPDSEQWNHVEKEKGKRVERDRSEWENDDSLDRKRKYARRDESTLAQFYRAMEESELSFREKVKERLQAPENYEKVSDCISSFKSKFVTAAQFRTLVDSLIGKHPDLMEMGEEFITYIEKYGSIRNNKVPRSSKAEEDGDDHDRDDKAKDHDNRERDRYDRGLAFSKDASGQRISYSNKEKFLAKPIHELDLSESKSCTPSYRRLPDNYPIPPSSCRTEIGTQVLNDHWVSVTSGSEDYSFKHMRKNQYEESLFRCEDDRFELDMLLESVNTTVKRVEDILDRMNAHTNKASSSYLEELSALNLRCIERLYGDHGLDVMDVLRKNAPLALPVILTRLKQKQEEWARCRADFNKVWAEIYAKNYHKSLDHRSFYFKQQDTKNLSAKALLAEIKELSEKNQTEDGLVLLSIAAGYKQPIKPDMEFEYVDADIQEDLYQLMEYSSGEVCTPDQSDKVMKIWSNFIDLVFEVYSHPPVTGDKEENAVKATKNPVAENVSNTVEENCIPTPDTLLCDAPGNEPMQIDDNMISAKSCASQQAGGLLKEEASSSAGVKNVNEENVSDALKGPDAADGSLRKEAMLSQGPLKRTSSPISKAPKGSSPIAKVQKLREETEACAKNEREEGELSPNRNLEEVADMCIDRAPEENDAMAEDEGEDSASDNSDNPSEENGDVSGSESANGKGEDENDQKADESEGEVDARENEGSTSFSDRSLRTARPLAINLLTKTLGKEENRVFYGNDSFYLLFRLHHMLYERMLSAKLHSSSSENRWRVSKEHADSYARFKDALRNLLNGSSDNAKFEDECRAIIGAQSYVLFTLDKLIHKLVKQVQTIASDEIDNKLLHLYVYERLRNPGTFSDEVYFANARFLVPDDNLYRIECLPCPERLTIQLMINEHDKFEPTAVSMDPDFLSYLKDELLGDVPQKLGKPWVFLRRNKRKLYNGDDISNFDKAMEGLIVHNGMEIKVHSVTKKIAYVLDTEDFLYRKKSRRQSLYRASTCDASSSAASNGNSKSKSIKRGNLLFS